MTLGVTVLKTSQRLGRYHQKGKVIGVTYRCFSLGRMSNTPAPILEISLPDNSLSARSKECKQYAD